MSNFDTTPRTDAADLDLLRRQVEIQRRLIKLSKENGIAFYRPHYKQHLFHSSPAKRRGAFTGNRWGKSQMDAAETVAWMLGERPWYRTSFDILGVDHEEGRNRRVVVKGHHPGDVNGVEHPLVRQGIPAYATKQLVVCESWDKVDRVWTSQMADRPGKIWQFLPKGVAKGYTNHAGVISEIHIISGPGKGSVLYFLSVDAFKRDKMVAESEDFDRVAFDEPAPQSLWKGLARGLVDRRGQADFALTSIAEVWISDKFEGDPSSPTMDLDDRPFPTNDRFSLRGSMADNPHLTDQAIADFENELTEDERQCRLHGQPLERTGLIYKEFHKLPPPDGQVLTTLPQGWSDWHTPHKSCILHVRVDTHPVKPHAVMFAAVGPSEIPIVCHEIYRACDADTLCEEINAYIKHTGCFLGSLKVEPAAWNPDPATRTAPIASYFLKHGLFPQKAVKDLSTGIIIVRAKLKNRQVLFTPECHRTFWEFSRYRYDPETGKPIDEEDHMMENLYRLLSGPTRWFDPDRAQGEPIPEDDFSKATVGLYSDS